MATSCTRRSAFFSTVRKINHWNNLLRVVVESPSLEIFKVWWGRVIDNLIQALFLIRGWTRHSFKVPSNPGCSVIPSPTDVTSVEACLAEQEELSAFHCPASDSCVLVTAWGSGRGLQSTFSRTFPVQFKTAGNSDRFLSNAVSYTVIASRSTDFGDSCSPAVHRFGPTSVNRNKIEPIAERCFSSCCWWLKCYLRAWKITMWYHLFG